MSELAALDPQVSAALDELLGLLGQNETIKKYQLLAAKIEKSTELAELEEAIKVAQKETVNFAHYGKIQAAKVEKAKADALTATFNAHPLVVAYRDSLYEANDLLQYMTGLIEERVNLELTGGDGENATKD